MLWFQELNDFYKKEVRLEFNLGEWGKWSKEKASSQKCALFS